MIGIIVFFYCTLSFQYAILCSKSVITENVVKINFSFPCRFSSLTLWWRRSLSMICFANQWTGFHVIGTSVMKELRILRLISKFRHSYKKTQTIDQLFIHIETSQLVFNLNQSTGFRMKHWLEIGQIWDFSEY